MKNYDKKLKLFYAFQEVEDDYLADVENEMTGAKETGAGKFRWGKRPGVRRFHVLAACIALFLVLMLVLPLSAAAIASKWFGVRDLRLPGADELYSETSGSERQEGIESKANPNVTISLSGYYECPESKALAEWLAFQEEYDKDGAIVAQIGNRPTGLEERYGEYLVYTQEMADKLDEIVEKYGLKLHTEVNVISPEELVYRVGGEFVTISQNPAWAYIYEDGTFQYDGDLMLGDRSVDFQFGRRVKGTLNEVYLNIGDVNEYQELPYLTAGGEQVVLALGTFRALIYADYDDCFILMNVLEGRDSGLTADDLKAIADGIDFTVLKNVRVPEMRGDSVPSDGITKLRPFTWEQEFVNLGFGYLVFEMPEEGEDYKLYYIPRDPDEHQEADFYYLAIRAEQAEYVFPDARSGNAPIGSFRELWFYEQFKAGTEDAGLFIVAIYEKDGQEIYDTRIYRASESGWGYELDEEEMRKLNEKYRDAGEDYPCWDICRELDCAVSR